MGDTTSSKLQRPESRFVVVVRVNTHCSLSCSFCGYSREVAFPRSGMNEATMVKLIGLLDQFRSQSHRDVLMVWIGGEPLQWTHWQRMGQMMRERNLPLGISTNGIRLGSKQIREQVLEQVSELTVSIDGLQSHHDQLRRLPGLFERLKGIVNQIQHSPRRRSVVLRVNTVLTRETIAEFPAFVEEMARWGFDELTFNPLGGNERPEFIRDHHLRLEDVQWFADRLGNVKLYASTQGLNVLGSERYLKRIFDKTCCLPHPIIDCGPGSEFLFVDDSGLASPCSFVERQWTLPIQEIETFTTLEDRFRERRGQRAYAPCGDCKANHVFEKFDRDGLPTTIPPPTFVRLNSIH